MNTIERKVNCGSCRLCCHDDTILIHPELGDDPSQYETEPVGKYLMLKHKPNGDCIYLDETGCSIYERRPGVCKKFDCADFVRITPRRRIKIMIAEKMIGKNIVKRGRELLREMRLEHGN